MLRNRRSPSDRPRRLLVAVPGGEYGGAERYAVRIAAAAAREGWEVAAAVRRYPSLAPMRGDLTRAGVRVLGLVRGERSRELLGFAAMVWAYRPDVVHLTLPWPVAAARFRTVCALLGVPAVLVHAAVPDAADLRVRHAWLYRLSRRRRQRWVAVSAFGATMLRQTFGLRPADDITIIHNAPSAGPIGADASPAESGGTPRDDARVALGVDQGAPLVVSVGRLTHEKGHDVLVAAAAHLVKEWPRVQVLIAGEGAGREQLQDLIDQAALGEHVRLIGQIEDVQGLLRAADVFAFPSRREGAPLALLEAMSAGVPVVASDFGGVEEIVQSGETGLVVRREDTRALAEGIAELIRDPERARDLAEGARQRVAAFSEPVMLDSTLSLLAAAADGTAPLLQRS
jgi:glycosyltransferase involved in cell wall biosynthesis